MRKEYTFRQHETRWLVFAPDGQPNLALSKYANFLSHDVAENTFKAYSRQIKKWLSFLRSRKLKGFDTEIWNLEPGKIRSLVHTFLTEECRCKVGLARHHEDALMVRPKQEEHKSPRQFMASLAHFYRILRLLGFYSYRNPLVIPKEDLDAKDAKPIVRRMPQISGCEKPFNPRERFSDNYFVFRYQLWKPQSIDCPEFPGLVYRGGSKVGWSLRERLIWSILFESGCRISEVLALTLKDLTNFKLGHGADAISKGYAGERIKFLTWSERTTKLLIEYFDIERKKNDSRRWTLNDYIRRNDDEILRNTPIFLTRQGTQLHTNTFRLRYWNPAVKAAGINANIHQTRHWHVTRYMKHVFDRYSTSDISHPAVANEIASFTTYMFWKSSETLKSYNHLFTHERVAQFQHKVHADVHSACSANVDVQTASSVEKKSALQKANASLARLFSMTRAKK